jgi:hypothetical protein
MGENTAMVAINIRPNELQVICFTGISKTFLTEMRGLMTAGP